MQPPDSEREVLVQLASGEVDIAQYKRGAWVWRGEIISIVAWCELPTTVEQGATLVPITPEIADMIVRAADFCHSEEHGVALWESEKLLEIFGALDKHA